MQCGRREGQHWATAGSAPASLYANSIRRDLNPLSVGIKDCINPWVNAAEEFNCRNTGHAVLKRESELKPHPGVVKLKQKHRTPADALKP